MNWAPVLGQCQEPRYFAEPAYSLGLVRGPACLFFKLNQLPPSPWLRQVWARAVSLLESDTASTWPFRAGLVRALSLSNVL